MIRRRHLLAAAPLALATPALAQPAFPSRAMRIVVPFPPGGAVDITGRLLAERLQPLLGQNVVVDNRGGAGGNLGADLVAKAEKDGHTFLLGSASIFCANKYLYRRSMPFDPARDLAPITRVSTGTLLLVVNSGRPWQNFAELVAAAKRDPGKLTMGSSGTGTASHLAIEKVKRSTGTDITHIPYRGGGPAISDLVAGTIDMMFDVMPALMPHVREGRFRPLAVASADRVTYVPGLEQVPGMKELLPDAGIDVQSWYGTAAPAGTPADRLAVLHRVLKQVSESDDFRTRLQPLGFTPVADASPEAATAYYRSQDRVWQEMVELSGATLD